MNELLTSDVLANLFPAEESIPEQYRILEQIEQREYLINGEMKVWQGNLNPVLSPVFVKENDSYKQKVPVSTSRFVKKSFQSSYNCRGLI